ncbi:uncharacterized protein LOC129761210 [Toxorhynchites rutilus septentrionalis]|uniref:uncharacterized protein LOC129761210 n=1 Tax=Toxorhynchites rutilus septentrionalis TaxID=329112 RepID=UPI0024785D1C|nr:uncharacterized protein LOC129761210 [Toxorhynchites rutilus septentrionalis]
MKHISRRVWYLPLNVVLHPRKPGKKRLVWDAAAQVDGISLNSQLLKGLDQLVSLPSVICKFRERQIGFGGDIKEMFHQILIRSVDKHSQRFLFRFDTTTPPDVYIMDVATFGATCSPCSAQYVLRKNADRFAEKYPDAVAAVKSKMYMDDYYDTPEEAGERALQVKNIHSSAGFDMCNWVSNSSEVLLRLGEPVVQSPREFVCEDETKWEQVLGITWDPIRDVLSFSTNLRAELIPYVVGKQRPTKRIALRIIMSLFDPLGLLAPFTIHGRMLVQDLWRSGLQWDEEMQNEGFDKWVRWTNLFPKISELQIPRCYFNGARPTTYKKVQVHVFTDASDKGYGCAAYFRSGDGEEIRCALAISKAKVASLKHLSIPRMELEGAVLGARLLQNVRVSHSYEIGECFLWTDSTTEVAWIRSDHRKYKQFVAHRIGEILSLTQPESWRWVPSKANIADSLTKWGRNTEPESNNEWFAGPSFLYLPQNQWPLQRAVVENVQEELRSCYQLHHISLPIGIVDVERISRWNILLRTMACVYRFMNNCRRRIKGLPIEALEATELQKRCLKRVVPMIKIPFKQEEFQRAEQWLWQIAQGDCYPDEVKTLLQNRDVPIEMRCCVEKSSPLYKMSAFADEFGVLRVEGRTEAATFAPFDARFPIILPRNHPITFKLLDHYHCRFGHASRETVVNEIRQRYDVPQLRSVVGKVMKDCDVR